MRQPRRDPSPPPRTRHQRGVALVLSMLILFVMTVMGVAAVGSAALDTRVVGFFRESTDAFYRAEACMESVQWDYDTFLDPTVPVRTATGTRYQAELRFQAYGTSPVGSGTSAKLFKTLNWRATCTGFTGASLADATAHKTVVQSIHAIVPTAPGQ